ncbi:TIGR00270 family protein [Candidatus Woesearchaeota archaeon]|nr:TIGR00270 family protein [Candidatus Woesearchaeota archaeon]
MPACHICGASRERLVKSLIEGTSVSVCENCAKFGRTIENSVKRIKKTATSKVEEIDIIEDDYFLKIKNARERKGLTQDELAKILAEKESSLHHIEAGKLKPTIELAKKIEKTLGISIISKDYAGGNVVKKLKSDAPMTIGDLIKSKHDK